MLSLSFTTAKKLLDTNREQIAQSLKLGGKNGPIELYIGQGPTTYMSAEDADKYLTPWEHVAGLNPIYRHLTEEGLKDILKRGRFVITDED